MLFFFFTRPSGLYLLLQFRQQSQPTWFAQAAAAQRALPEHVLSQSVIRDFHSTAPDALHYSKLSCSVPLVQQITPAPQPPAQDHWLPVEHIHPCLIVRVFKQ